MTYRLSVQLADKLPSIEFTKRKMVATVLIRIFLVSIFSVLFQDFSKADSAQGLLRCYFCQDTFENVYDPYTDCQTNVSNVPVDTCLDTNKFCMTQRTTVKGITVSISRSCTDECYYGCMFYDFGVTQFICTSCCNYSLCNTDAGTRGSHHIVSPQIFVVTVAVFLWTSCIILKEGCV